MSPPVRRRLAFINIEQGHFRKGLVRKTNRQWTPYSLAIMAAMQRDAGHDCRVFDANACRWSNRDLVRRIAAYDPDFVVFATQPSDRWQNPYPSLDRQADFLRRLRETSFAQPVIACGPHPTLLPESFFRAVPGVDYAIRGEPEPGVDALIRRLGTGEPLTGVPGLSIARNGDVAHFGEEERVPDLNALPLPAYDLLPMQAYQFHFYSKVEDPQHRFAYIETNRGCPFACSFCNLKMYGRKVRRFAVQRVLGEIDLLVQEYGVNYIFFGDLTFGIHKKDTELLLQGLIERNYPLRWSCQTRADIADRHFMALASRAGCHRIEAGIETADPALLQGVKKIEISRLQTFVRDLREHDIKLECGHLIGLPGQTARDVVRSAEFMRQLGVRFKITAVTVPYPHTVDFQKALADRQIRAADWDSIVQAAGKCGNSFTDGDIRRVKRRVQAMYYRHIFRHGLRRVLFAPQHRRKLRRAASSLIFRPRVALGAIKRTFEDAVYGDE